MTQRGAYFSNFIEGTEFDLPDALAVVYEGKSLPGRDDDSHDLLGTYQVVNDRTEMSMVAATPEDFVQLMRSRHATILAGRPALRPGEFKEAANRAGESLFVLPAYVPGTLRAGFERLAELDTAFERAVYMMFLGSEDPAALSRVAEQIPPATSSAFIITRAMRPLPSLNGCT